MAKGLAKHQEYLDALNLLGKDLARRARSKCELSEQPGSLEIYDLEGPPGTPELSHVLMVCPEVVAHLEATKLAEDNFHYLETAVWSTEPAVRRAAVKILEKINESWAHQAIENASTMD